MKKMASMVTAASIIILIIVIHIVYIPVDIWGEFYNLDTFLTAVKEVVFKIPDRGIAGELEKLEAA